MNPQPTREERTWAVVSHLSALALGMGILLPIVGWSEQRQKSRYASFHCLQALGYQSLGYTVWLLSYLVLLIFLLIIYLLAADNIQKSSPLFSAWVVLFLAGMFGLLGVYLVLPVIAAVACALGKDFHYPILGRRLARYLGYGSSSQTGEPSSLNEEHADRWVAAMGHFSVIIVFWGLLAPAAIWVLQGKRTPFLKLQAIQTTLYQVLVNLFYLGAMLLSLFGTVPLLALNGPSARSSTSMAGLFVFLATMLVALLFLMVVPLFHLLGQWAGYRLLKGDNYRYPLLGKVVQKQLANLESRSQLLDSIKELS